MVYVTYTCTHSIMPATCTYHTHIISYQLHAHTYMYTRHYNGECPLASSGIPEARSGPVHTDVEATSTAGGVARGMRRQGGKEERRGGEREEGGGEGAQGRVRERDTPRHMQMLGSLNHNYKLTHNPTLLCSWNFDLRESVGN